MPVSLDHLPAQDDYYNAQEDQVAFVGGVGTGKTMVASDDILRVASEYAQCGKSADNPGIAIFSNTYPQLIDGTIASFFERCEHWGLEYVNKVRQDHKIYIPRFDAWIGVWSVDNPINFKSLELCYVWIDEAQAWDKFAYDMVIGRLRGTARQRRRYPNMPLRARITANPPHTMDHWLVDLTTKPDPETGVPPVRLITASTYDNPFLTQDYIKRLRSNYDPETAEIELGGKFGEIGKGRIWRMFSRGKHVLSEAQALAFGLPALEYDPSLPLCWSHDFNIDPLCSILFQWRRVNVAGYQHDVMYVIDEMHIRHSVIDMAVKELLNREDACRIARQNGIILYGDTAGNQGNRQTALSDWEALRMALAKEEFSGETRLGVPGVTEGNPDHKLRFASGNRMLVDGNGDVGVVIHERCTNLAQDCERMYYKPGTSMVEIPKLKDGKPVKLMTHLGDAWSYPITYEYPIAELRA